MSERVTLVGSRKEMPTDTTRLSDPETLYNAIGGEELCSYEEFQTELDSLIDEGSTILEHPLNDDNIAISLLPGVSWRNFHHIDNKIKKAILLELADNPKTFFILQTTQKGKARITARKIREACDIPGMKPVTFVLCMNDKDLADQLKESIRDGVGIPVEIFVFSSNSSKDTEVRVKEYINAYSNPENDAGEYKPPIIFALPNTQQLPKVLKLMNYIHKRALKNSKVRTSIVIDEADAFYPKIRDQIFSDNGQNISLKLFTCDDDSSILSLGFCTATEDSLMDYPECANAHLIDGEFDETTLKNYRAIHLEDAILKVNSCKNKTNNEYAEMVFQKEKDHFLKCRPNGEFPKVIVNSDSKNTSQDAFISKRVNEDGCYGMTFNMNGVTLHRLGFPPKKFSCRKKRLNDVLMYIYKKYNLHDKPLFLAGRRKVDRGLSFHYAPRNKDNTRIQDMGDGELIVVNGEGLIWTDIILGKIECQSSATQKAGRLAGVIAQCPNYSGKTYYWTDHHTASMVIHHNKIVDSANTHRGSSVIQALSHAKDSTPPPPEEERVRDYELSDTFSSVAEAKRWANTNLNYGNSAYGIYIENNERCIKYRGEYRQIMTEEEVRSSYDLGQGANTSARIMPVKDLGWGVASSARVMPVGVSTDKSALNYIVIYKKDELKE